MENPNDDAEMSIELEMGSWLGRNLRRATNAVFGQFASEFAPFNIRPALYLALSIIERFPGSSGAELSDYMTVPRANTVVLLKELEGRGLIKRAPNATGRRAQAISLTEAGHALMIELHAAHERHVAYLESVMSEAESNFLNALLQRLWKPQAGSSPPSEA